MILRYTYLHRHPALFKAMTGLRLAEFDDLALGPAAGLSRRPRGRAPRQPTRQRAVGGGHPYALSTRATSSC